MRNEMQVVRLMRAASVVLVLGAGSAATAHAQGATPPPYQQVVSANPFGLLLDLFNAEYERIVTESSTAGIGGSAYFGDGDDLDTYVNADVFWRFYPGGEPLNGWAFGVKAGITSVGDEGTFFGAGFDLNRSWVLGRNDNFYVGIGIGLKRIYVSSNASFDLRYVPTFRIVNVGYVF